jgi:hypothetical protein
VQKKKTVKINMQITATAPITMAMSMYSWVSWLSGQLMIGLVGAAGDWVVVVVVEVDDDEVVVVAVVDVDDGRGATVLFTSG